MVRPKKFLGQHFLKDTNIARKIVESLVVSDTNPVPVLEIGPGMGVLTKFLIDKVPGNLYIVEIDGESIDHLQKLFPSLEGRIIHADFLRMDLRSIIPGPFAIIGNFPYNISSQILFAVLDNKDRVSQVVCMLQKEVADRICAKHGSKVYGILSVLLQAYYDIENLFNVSPGVFNPPPKVISAVIRLRRNDRKVLPCDEERFRNVVKQAFQKRRKTLRNALKHLNLPDSVGKLELMDKRPEQLSVDDFIFITQRIEHSERVR